MATDTTTLGLIQHACPTDAAPGATLAVATELIREAAGRGARLIATQELFVGPYFCQTEEEAQFDRAEPVPDGPTTGHLQQLADELGVAITGSLFEKRAPGVYHNTSVMIDPRGAVVDCYRKMHIPDDPRFYEKYYFTPGDLGFRAQQVDGVHTGMLICWDQWYPEAARLTALKGAQVLFYPTAIGWYHGETQQDKQQQLEAWQTVQKSHAIANGVFVAAINRIGTEDELTFWGNSFVCDPGGTVIAQASATEPEALVVKIDFAQVESWRRGWPFLRDRRIDAYGPITQRLID